jgi:hypothetical protein
LANAAIVIAIAVPAVLGYRQWNAARAVGVSWAILVVVTQSIAVLGYLYPHSFGWNPTEVAMPDAPGMIPAAIVALFITSAAYFVGMAASSLRPRMRH